MGINKSMLPDTVSYFENTGHKTVGNGKKFRTQCHIHGGDGDNLSVLADSGAFYCFTCGAKGGDIIDYEMQVTGADFVTAVKALPGFIEHGVVAIAGAPGVGKTTALLPLSMIAARLHGDGDLKPHEWRHVVYVSEDVEQAKRIISGIVKHGNLGVTLEAVRERIHLVAARRLTPSYVAQVGSIYRKQFARTVNGVEVLPLVVLDTKSAIIEVENENDNSQNSAMIAALKQGFSELPVWLVGHVAKTHIGRTDVAELSNRGGGSIDGDCNQTLFLIAEGDKRYLAIGKHRFEPQWRELEIVSHSAQTSAVDEFGRTETVVLRWGLATPPQISRKDAAIEAKEQAKKDDAAALRQSILDAVATAWNLGNPLNRGGVKSKLGGKGAVVGATTENLLHEGWLYEVEIPSKDRIVSSKRSYLITFTTLEHEAYMQDGSLPEDKLIVPATWKKPVSPIPVGNECDVPEVPQHVH